VPSARAAELARRPSVCQELPRKCPPGRLGVQELGIELGGRLSASSTHPRATAARSRHARVRAGAKSGILGYFRGTASERRCWCSCRVTVGRSSRWWLRSSARLVGRATRTSCAAATAFHRGDPPVGAPSPRGALNGPEPVGFEVVWAAAGTPRLVSRWRLRARRAPRGRSASSPPPRGSRSRARPRARFFTVPSHIWHRDARHVRREIRRKQWAMIPSRAHRPAAVERTFSFWRSPNRRPGFAGRPDDGRYYPARRVPFSSSASSPWW